MNQESSSTSKLPEAFTDLIRKGLHAGLGKELEKGLQKGIDHVFKEVFKTPSSQKTPDAQTQATPNEVESLVGGILEALNAHPAPGAWQHETLVVQGNPVERVRTGDHDVTGLGMKAEDAAYIAAVNPQAISTLLLDWKSLRSGAEQATRTQAMTSGATLEKLHSGDALSNEELTALVQHFRALSPLLTALGPTWALARDAAWRELQRSEEIARARGLVVGE